MVRGYTILLLISLGLLSCTSKSDSQEITSSDESATEDSGSSKKSIVFFGNSLTAGFGLDISEAFPQLIQDRIDSLGLNYSVINAGVSGETTASGNSRIDWVLRNPIDVFVLELGANDGLRGIPTDETRKNLGDIITKVRDKNPDVRIVLAGMLVPPNMGEEYSKDFQSIFPEIAAENNVKLIPFLLKDVGGEPELNQDDGIHPTAEGHKIVAQNVWDELKGVL